MRLVDEVEISTIKEEYFTVSGKDIKWQIAEQYPACQSLDLFDYFDIEKYKPWIVKFKFLKTDNLGVSLMLEERNKAVSRSLYSNRLSYSGPPLDMKNLSQATFHSSVHRISQRLDSELDNNVNCVNYPNGDFQTFRGYGLISRENLVTIFQLLPTDILVTAKS